MNDYFENSKNIINQNRKMYRHFLLYARNAKYNTPHSHRQATWLWIHYHMLLPNYMVVCVFFFTDKRMLLVFSASERVSIAIRFSLYKCNLFERVLRLFDSGWNRMIISTRSSFNCPNGTRAAFIRWFTILKLSAV